MTTDQIQARLAEKLHPRVLRESPMVHAVLAHLLGMLEGDSGDNALLGRKADLDRNLSPVAKRPNGVRP